MGPDTVYPEKDTMKKKILFLIHDLGHGGAEKVLVNLVNNIDQSKFDIFVMALSRRWYSPPRLQMRC